MKIDIYGTTRYIFVEDFKGKDYRVVEEYDSNCEWVDYKVYEAKTDKEVEDDTIKEEILEVISKEVG